MDQQQIPPEIRSFLESMLKDAGMVATDDIKEQMLQELFIRLDSYITSIIVDNLPAENLEAFMKLNEEQKDKQEIEKFIKDNLPNSQDIFAKAFVDFREMYLNNIEESRSNTAHGK